MSGGGPIMPDIRNMPEGILRFMIRELVIQRAPGNITVQELERRTDLIWRVMTGKEEDKPVPSVERANISRGGK